MEETLNKFLLVAFLVVFSLTTKFSLADNSLLSLIPKTVSGPQTLSDWMISTMKYQKEIFDNWKTPKRTIRDKGGDCEDFAFLTRDVLRELGYSAHVAVMTNRKANESGHAVCIFQYPNKEQFGVMDNQHLITGRWMSTAEYALYLYADDYGIVKFCNQDKQCYYSAKIKEIKKNGKVKRTKRFYKNGNRYRFHR